MVKLVGWLPDLYTSTPGTSNLNQFIKPFEAIDTGDVNYPVVRSGHRCFTDNDYLYVVGGYSHELRAAIHKEVWVMSLATFEWRRYEENGELPETLASFAIVQMFPHSKTFILFGGSGLSFGSSSSNRFYIVRVNNDTCSIESRRLEVEGTIPPPIYGHAMCAGETPGKYYIIGGTEGAVFNFDVHELTVRVNCEAKNKKDAFIWHCELISKNSNLTGRYRLEATYDEKKHRLIFFGGGNLNEVYGFEKMATLHIQSRVTTEFDTVPDSEHGFPARRRCHTIVRCDRRVIMTGGIGHSAGDPEPPLHSDVWIFNMDNNSWKKYEYSLPKAVFFHDAAITEDGWMLSFGGAHGIEQGCLRNNVLHGAWFGVPRLQRFALEALRKKFPNMFSGLYCGNLRPSEEFEVFNAFCKEGRIFEKEIEIIKSGKIRFHEKEDKTRYFLNSNAEEFTVRHPVNDEANPQPQQRRRRNRRRLENNIHREFERNLYRISQNFA